MKLNFYLSRKSLTTVVSPIRLKIRPIPIAGSINCFRSGQATACRTRGQEHLTHIRCLSVSTCQFSASIACRLVQLSSLGYGYEGYIQASRFLKVLTHLLLVRGSRLMNSIFGLHSVAVPAPLVLIVLSTAGRVSRSYWVLQSRT